MVRSVGCVALSVAGFVVASCSTPASAPPPLAELVVDLSEKGGYFDTDNLISNETAYAQVVEDLEPSGGVYIGVGPEQNFHYIGRLRPTWAFIMDIRRDNMLHQLLLNALLVEADTPAQYLCALFSRECDAAASYASFDALVAAVDATAPDEELFRENLASVYDNIDERIELTLTEDERRMVELIYRAYFDEQLELRFRSHGRRPMAHHPTYRRLLIEESPGGTLGHFLSRPDDYAHVRELARSGRLVPVVGNFAGPHALRRIARFVEEQGETVTAFYTSNVEFYLLRDGSFPTYVENVRALPLASDAQFIRSYFSYGYPHPAALPGHRSTLVRQNMNRFLELYDDGAFSDYWDVSTLDYEP